MIQKPLIVTDEKEAEQACKELGLERGCEDHAFASDRYKTVGLVTYGIQSKRLVRQITVTTTIR